MYLKIRKFDNKQNSRKEKTMNNNFKTAHKAARETRDYFPSYRSAFVYALTHRIEKESIQKRHPFFVSYVKKDGSRTRRIGVIGVTWKVKGTGTQKPNLEYIKYFDILKFNWRQMPVNRILNFVQF